jgi:ornithine cyclodeaminase/alanine dehydrogenase-like protein (mu-crystallin family)
MLVLTKQDMLDTLTMKETMEAVKEAFLLYGSGSYTMPSRLHMEDDNNTFLVMPCGTNEAFGTKLVSVFPENKAKDLPVTQGIVVLNDIETGVPLSLMNGTILTAVRTGAVGGVGIAYLAHPESSKVALIGAGIQGLYQILAACEARKISDVFVYSRTVEKVEAFITTLKEKLPYPVQLHLAGDAEEAISQADIIITATTSAEPVLPNEAGLYRGKLIVGIGSFRPEMREFPQALYKEAEAIYVDTKEALHETGDLRVPLDERWVTKSQVHSFAEVMVEKKQPHLENGSAIIFKSVGMALFDVKVAYAFYQKAKRLGIGQTIEI